MPLVDANDQGASRARKAAAMPLSMVRSGCVATLAEVRAGRGLVRRLSSMGLVPGVDIEVLKSSFGGPIMVRVKGSKVMLGRGMAHAILVNGPG